MPVIVAYIACAILAALAVFQIALIAGAPLGRFAWGGLQHVLPSRLRVVAGAAIVVYVLAAIVIVQAVSIVSVLPGIVDRVAIWVAAACAFGGFVGSAVSRNPSERAVMAPIHLALAALCVFVAVTGHLVK